jgi:alpha-beta hydrolase superfamily lysophospholipase
MPLATLFPPSTTLVATLGLLGGLLLIALVAVVEWGAWILVNPGRPIALPADEPYPGEHMEIDASDGVRLAGTWHAHPDAEGRTLVLLHGLAEGRHMMRVRSDEIYARGWNVAVLDARGYGDSGGELNSFGGREVGDLAIWLDTIAARVGPSLRLAIWGRSMGAAVALRAAADDAKIRALVLEAPYIDLRRTAATLIRRYRLPASKPLAILVLARARWLAGVSLARPRPLDAAPRVKVPALILRGTADALVSEEETAALAAALGGPVERMDVSGARHSKIVDVGGAELIERVGTFLGRVV